MFGETLREGCPFYLMIAKLALGFREGIISPHTIPYIGYVMKAEALRRLC
jgi:hypothetical protein